jgi:hypothetical protein
MATLLGVKGLAATTPGFRKALYEGAIARGLDPDHLATVIAFESGFQPGAKNRYSNAVGLIQWVSDASFAATARAAGQPSVTRSDLPSMSAEEQLPFVLAWYQGKGVSARSSLIDHYLAVFMPALVGKPRDYVAARAGTLAYSQNPGFDRDGKGYYTVADIGRAIEAVAAAGAKAPRVSVPSAVESPLSRGLSPLAVAVLVGGIAFWALPRVAATRRLLALAG